MFDGFDLDHERLFDQQVSAKGICDADVINLDRNWLLFLDKKSPRAQLLTQHNLIN